VAHGQNTGCTCRSVTAFTNTPDLTDESNVEEIRVTRKNIDDLIDNCDYQRLFMATCCHLYAQALGQNLGLPLFYECPEYENRIRHAFVMKGSRCFDYNGEEDISVFAARYGESKLEKPRPLALECIRAWNTLKGITDKADKVLAIAHSEVTKRRGIYHL
jgi:hypothetical protein